MNKKRGLGLFGLLIVIAIIFGGTWWVSKNLDSIKTKLGLNATSSAIDLAKQAVQKVEQRTNLAADWKLFNDPQLGISFNYPAAWPEPEKNVSSLSTTLDFGDGHKVFSDWGPYSYRQNMPTFNENNVVAGSDKVYSPSRADVWYLGQTVKISWDPEFIDASTIYLVRTEPLYENIRDVPLPSVTSSSSNRYGGVQIYRRETLDDPVSLKGELLYKLPNSLGFIYPGTYKISVRSYGERSFLEGETFQIKTADNDFKLADNYFYISGIKGMKERYQPNEKIQIKIDAREGDGGLALPHNGFNIQGHIFEAVFYGPSGLAHGNAFFAENAVYEPLSGKWILSSGIPHDPSKLYMLEISLYCGFVGMDSKCAQNYGGGPAVTSRFLFKVNRATSQSFLTIPVEEKTISWNNYRNGTYGFSFQYPPAFTPKSEGPNATTDSGTVQNYLDKISFTSYWNESDNFSLIIFPPRATASSITIVDYLDGYLSLGSSCDNRWNSPKSNSIRVENINGRDILIAEVNDARCYYTKDTSGNLLVFNFPFKYGVYNGNDLIVGSLKLTK